MGAARRCSCRVAGLLQVDLAYQLAQCGVTDGAAARCRDQGPTLRLQCNYPQFTLQPVNLARQQRRGVAAAITLNALPVRLGNSPGGRQHRSRMGVALCQRVARSHHSAEGRLRGGDPHSVLCGAL